MKSFNLESTDTSNSDSRRNTAAVDDPVAAVRSGLVANYESLCQSGRGVSLNYIYEPLTDDQADTSD